MRKELAVACLLSLFTTWEGALAAEESRAGESARGDDFKMSAVLQTEFSNSEVGLGDGGRSVESSLALAELALEMDYTTMKEISGHVLFLYEEGGEKALIVDEAYVEMPVGGFRARIGRQYLPFITSESGFSTPPLTLDLGELNPAALSVVRSLDPFELTLFVFQGALGKEGADSRVEDYGAVVAATSERGWRVALGYLSDLADAGALDPAKVLPQGYVRKVPGLSLAFAASTGDVGVEVQAVGAVSAFSPRDLDGDGDGKGESPFAWNAEANVSHGDILYGARLGGSGEWTDHPALQYGAFVSRTFDNGATLTGELIREEHDRDFSEIRWRNLLVVALSVAF